MNDMNESLHLTLEVWRSQYYKPHQLNNMVYLAKPIQSEWIECSLSIMRKGYYDHVTKSVSISNFNSYLSQVCQHVRRWAYSATKSVANSLLKMKNPKDCRHMEKNQQRHYNFLHVPICWCQWWQCTIRHWPNCDTVR